MDVISQTIFDITGLRAHQGYLGSHRDLSMFKADASKTIVEFNNFNILGVGVQQNIEMILLK